ncbi:YeeE/YedE family protein [Tissierella sp. MSJ-40]|uniref:YeeE/YedE family protein n=1 Tax=Tissierella simiarum TaxID=2841534 RepID=A0ABS6EBZ4_9FIRM|nr:YeeE/YedE thiosulfate transporter family protein [Tissierella simiarum]MBU5439688.1 YeeE/YedE family protein [Tissierella simiarum]
MESTKNVSRKRKKRVNQIPFGVALLVGVIIIGYLIKDLGPKHPMTWMFGILLGFTLRNSRFCFTASLRDPILTGGTNLSKAVIVAITVATIGFSAIQYGAFLKGDPIPGNINPAGIHIAVGAFMFGIGMVIAGGCASGTIMRVGEGFVMQWLSLVFFILGSLWGAKDYGFWKSNFMDKGLELFLPDAIGWFPSLIVQFGLLLGLFILADWFGNRSKN